MIFIKQDMTVRGEHHLHLPHLHHPPVPQRSRRRGAADGEDGARGGGEERAEVAAGGRG